MYELVSQFFGILAFTPTTFVELIQYLLTVIIELMLVIAVFRMIGSIIGVLVRGFGK